MVLADGLRRDFVNKAKIVGNQNSDVGEQPRVAGRASQPEVALDLSALIQSGAADLIYWHILEILKY